MAIGPVQLVALGFRHEDFPAALKGELERLHDTDAVRVIDALAVYKDAAGDIEVEHLSGLSREEAIAVGSPIIALLGLCVEGEAEASEGDLQDAESLAERIGLFGGDEPWDVLGDVPDDSAAVLLLLEHHWAVPLRDAVARAEGYRIGDGFISPYDLVALGVLAADEVDELPSRQAGPG